MHLPFGTMVFLVGVYSTDILYKYKSGKGTSLVFAVLFFHTMKDWEQYKLCCIKIHTKKCNL